MNVLSWMVFGLIVGALAKLFMPGKDPGGMIVTVLLGIAGSVIAAHGVAKSGGWCGNRRDRPGGPAARPDAMDD